MCSPGLSLQLPVSAAETRTQRVWEQQYNINWKGHHGTLTEAMDRSLQEGDWMGSEPQGHPQVPQSLWCVSGQPRAWQQIPVLQEGC